MGSKKIITEVICPATSKTYDFVLEADMKAGDALEKIKHEIISFEKLDILFSEESSAELFYEGCTLPLDSSVRLEEYGITSGSRLMIV